MAADASFILTIVGPWRDADDLARRLAQTDSARLVDQTLTWNGEPVCILQVTPPSPSALAALVSDSQGRLAGPLAEQVLAAPSVTKVGLTCETVEQAGLVLRLGAFFAGLGALALHTNPPMKTHELEGWVALHDDFEAGRPLALYFAFVRLFRTPDDYVTCGMGSLGLRDFTVSREVGPDEALRVLELLAHWAILQRPVIKVGTLTTDGRGGHLVLSPRACEHYPPDCDEHNPLGVVKVVSVGR